MLDDSKNVVKVYYMLEQKDGKPAISEMETSPPLQEKEIPDSKTITIGEGVKREDVYFNLAQSREFSNEKTTFLHIGLFDENGYAKRVFHQGETAYFYYEILVKQDIRTPLIGTVIRDQKNIIVHGKDNLQMYKDFPSSVCEGSVLRYLQIIKLDIAIGEYTFEPGAADIAQDDYKRRGEMNQEEINACMERMCVRPNAGTFAVHGNPVGNPTRLLFHGCADLPGDILLSIKEPVK